MSLFVTRWLFRVILWLSARSCRRLTLLHQLLCDDQLRHVDFILQQVCNHLLSVSSVSSFPSPFPLFGAFGIAIDKKFVQTGGDEIRG